MCVFAGEGEGGGGGGTGDRGQEGGWLVGRGVDAVSDRPLIIKPLPR